MFRQHNGAAAREPRALGQWYAAREPNRALHYFLEYGTWPSLELQVQFDNLSEFLKQQIRQQRINLTQAIWIDSMLNVKLASGVYDLHTQTRIIKNGLVYKKKFLVTPDQWRLALGTWYAKFILTELGLVMLLAGWFNFDDLLFFHRNPGHKVFGMQELKLLVDPARLDQWQTIIEDVAITNGIEFLTAARIQMISMLPKRSWPAFTSKTMYHYRTRGMKLGFKPPPQLTFLQKQVAKQRLTYAEAKWITDTLDLPNYYSELRFKIPVLSLNSQELTWQLVRDNIIKFSGIKHPFKDEMLITPEQIIACQGFTDINGDGLLDYFFTDGGLTLLLLEWFTFADFIYYVTQAPGQFSTATPLTSNLFSRLVSEHYFDRMEQVLTREIIPGMRRQQPGARSIAGGFHRFTLEHFLNLLVNPLRRGF